MDDPGLHAAPLALALTLALLAAPAAAQCEAERSAVNDVIDEYARTEAAMDMRAQGRLMTADRVHVTGGGRMTDQAMNMELQQAEYDLLRSMMPGVRQFVEARDRMVRFHGGCDVAVASFTWHLMPVPAADTPPERLQAVGQMMGGAPPPSAITLVLEEEGGAWRIAHTHATPLDG